MIIIFMVITFTIKIKPNEKLYYRNILRLSNLCLQ